ncbi:MAG: FAD-dependent oxidoreductase [Candidatus Omnitrophota bacterium]
MSKRILILGGGLAGLSAAYFLKEKGIEAPVFEKEKECGGLCRSIKKDGFTFDFSGHLLHFRDSQNLALVKKLLKGNLVKHKRKAQVYAFNKFIPYPFQASLSYLPKEIGKRCFDEFIEAQDSSRVCFNGESFFEWVNKKFGTGIADYFMVPYNDKFWNTSSKKLQFSWAERFIAVPSVKDMVKSYKGGKLEDLGYNSYFWYPKTGGIEELIKAFCRKNKSINLGFEVKSIDLKNKVVEFKNKVKEKFDLLISTIPLPELSKIIKSLPDKIKADFKKLRWVSIYNLNLGLEGNVCSQRHWIYFPQKDISFFRTGFFHNFSSALAPAEKSSLYAEVSYSKNKPIDKKNITSRIIQHLKKTGILSKGIKVCVKQANDIKYGYPIYDHNYQKARDKLISYLADNNIISRGRFGNWRYFSMEDVIIEAKQTTDNV